MSSTGQGHRVSALPLGMASLGLQASGPEFKPNWIDYRTSVANVDRREQRGETAETCRECGCETDVSPVPHSPKCPTLAAPPRSPVAAAVGDGEDGRALLDRMDAGEPLVDVVHHVGTDLVVDDDDLDGPGETPTADRAASAAAGEPVGGASPDPPDPPAGPAASEDVTSTGGAGSKRPRGEGLRVVLEALAAGHETARAIGVEIGSPAGQVSNILRRLIAKGLAEKVKFGVFAATAAGVEAIASGASLDANQRSEREPRARDGASAAAPRNVQPPSRSDPRPLKVPRTGLAYHTALEAFAAADEVEADGERVAAAAREDGNEGKADQAHDAALELATRIRTAAHSFEARANPPADPERDPAPAVEDEPLMQLLVTPDEMAPFPRALGRALIVGMRAAADELERQISEDGE